MKNKKIIFFYFFIQIITSFIIIYNLILNNLFIINNFHTFITRLALFIKLSIPPFHLWLPLLSKFINWNIIIIILSLIKITPFYILSLIKLNSIIIYLILILCSIIPPYIIITTTNFKVIISYSSINHSAWIIFLIYFKNIIWFNYLILYILISLCLFLIINIFKLYINNIYILNNKINNFNLFILLFIFNIAGIPPFSFFYIKWYRIFLFSTYSIHLIILIILILRSLIIIFIYINIILNSIFLFKFKSKFLFIHYPLKNNFPIIMIYLRLVLSITLFII